MEKVRIVAPAFAEYNVVASLFRGAPAQGAAIVAASYLWKAARYFAKKHAHRGGKAQPQWYWARQPQAIPAAAVSEKNSANSREAPTIEQHQQ